MEAAVVLRGIHHHLLSMLVDVLFLIIIRVLQFFNHILYDTKGRPLSCVWNLNLKERCNSKFTIKLNIVQDTSTSVKLLLSPMLIDPQSADYLNVSPP